MARADNPYIGPRPFHTGETLYGRDYETRALYDLLLAERVVLLNAASGAGKTSLLNAALLPKLQTAGFVVPRPLRVSQQLPDGVVRPKGANAFIVSLLLGMEEGEPEDQQYELEVLLSLSLDAYLDRRRQERPDAGPVALLIDQFDEILTIDPNNRAAKTAFFDQIGLALAPSDRWALFSMREEFVGALEPYARHLPGGLATRFRLEPLREARALDAITGPAKTKGVAFEPEAARVLVELLTMRSGTQADDTAEELPIEQRSVEPVHLQVVMRRLWDQLPEGTTSITAEQVNQVGQISLALAAYYAEVVADARQVSGVSKRTIREWVGRELITEHGLRSQVPQQEGSTRGLDNRAIDALADGYLVRADTRRGVIWYELAHDRLVSPIRDDNAQWIAKHLHPLQRNAAMWAAQSHPPSLLLRGDALVEAEEWAAAHPDYLNQVEGEFLADCRAARERDERERRAGRRIKGLAIVATIAAVLATTYVIKFTRAYLNLSDVVDEQFGWSQLSFSTMDWDDTFFALKRISFIRQRTLAEELDKTVIFLGDADKQYYSDRVAESLYSLGFRTVTYTFEGRQFEAPTMAAPANEGLSQRLGVAWSLLWRPVNESNPFSNVTMTVGQDVDLDVVRLVMFTLRRANADAVQLIRSSAAGDANAIRVELMNGEPTPATGEPLFAALMEMEDASEVRHLARIAISDPSGVQSWFQEFEDGVMVGIKRETDHYYLLERPSQDDERGTWRELSSLEEMEQILGGPMKSAIVGPGVHQEFLGGAMLAPFPRVEGLKRTDFEGAKDSDVNVLALLDDGTYWFGPVPSQPPPQ